MLTCDAIQTGDIITVTIKGILTSCDEIQEENITLEDIDKNCDIEDQQCQ